MYKSLKRYQLIKNASCIPKVIGECVGSMLSRCCVVIIVVVG